jgi:hypothetical protein
MLIRFGRGAVATMTVVDVVGFLAEDVARGREEAYASTMSLEHQCLSTSRTWRSYQAGTHRSPMLQHAAKVGVIAAFPAMNDDVKSR